MHSITARAATRCTDGQVCCLLLASPCLGTVSTFTSCCSGGLGRSSSCVYLSNTHKSRNHPGLTLSTQNWRGDDPLPGKISIRYLSFHKRLTSHEPIYLILKAYRFTLKQYRVSVNSGPSRIQPRHL